MRTWIVVLVFAVACGGGKSKQPAPLTGSASPAAPAAKKPVTKFSVEVVEGRADGVLIEGVVRDVATKEPLVGATLVFSSPALQGEQVAISDELGKFAMSSLPPGPYKLTAYNLEQTTTGDFTVEQGKLAKITLDWDLSQKPGETVIIESPEPTFTSAMEALKKGAMGQAVRLGRDELAKKPSAQLHGVLAFATYAFAIEVFRVEGFGRGDGTAKPSETFKKAMTSFSTSLDQVQAHLAEAAKDPKFALELCVACTAGEDGYFMALGGGALDIERDRAGKELPENDPRRRPTYRFDHGDLAWSRAMINYQQALANITLAYDWSWIDQFASDDADATPSTKITIKLAEPARIAKARELLLAGLVASDEARLAFLAETDDDREWVPSPKQKNYASPLAVDAALYKTWEAVVDDVRKLVAGETGISLKAVWTLVGAKRNEAPAGFVDLGAMLRTPKDIVFELGSIDRIEVEKNAAKRAKMTATLLQGILGNGFKTSMKPSKLTDRLLQLRTDRELAETVFEDKLKYVFWLN